MAWRFCSIIRNTSAVPRPSACQKGWAKSRRLCIPSRLVQTKQNDSIVMKNMWWQVIPSSNGCVCLRASSLGVDLKLNGPLTKLVLQGCYGLNYGLATQVHNAKLPLSTSKWDGVSSKTRGSQNLYNACQTVTRPSLRSTEIESAEIFRWRFSGTIDSYDSYRKSEKIE